MASRDIYRFINDLSDEVIQRIIERLEFRRQDQTFRGWLEVYLDKMALPSSASVLTIGCGTGVEARILATRPGFSGRIVGLDQSPALIKAAQRFADQEGVGQQIEFHTGDVHELDYEDDSFDAVISHTLISHVTDPLTVLKEAARVVKPEGQVVVFDGDYASWTFGYSDPAFAKTMDETLIDYIVNNPQVLRTLPRLLSQAGLYLEEATPYIFAEIGKGSFFLGAAETYAPLISKAGLLPTSQVEDWLSEQRQNHEDGTFFAASNYYTYRAKHL